MLVILFLGSGYAFAPLFVVGQWALVALIALVSADGFLLYRTNAIQAERHCADRFSNGDENEVAIRVENSYPRPVSLDYRRDSFYLPTAEYQFPDTASGK